MELSELKSTWNTVETPEISAAEIKDMLSENKHPVLKGIRKQLTIEIIGWSAFLAFYYTMFDGDLKPLWINLLLILCVLLPIIHNLTGYHFSKHLVHGTTIQESLRNYLAKIKRYALISIILRQLYLTGLLLFFTYGLSLNVNKYVSLAIISLVFLIQLLLTYRIWAKRLTTLKNSLDTFS